MKNLFFLILFLTLTPFQFSFSAIQFLEFGDSTVKMTHPASQNWILGEEVCFVRAEETLSCGTIVESNNDWAIADIGPVARQIQAGDRVQTYSERVSKSSKSSSDFGMFTLGIEGGSGYYYPIGHLQIRIAEDWYLGALGSYSKSQDSGFSIKTTGGYLTINKYAKEVPFKGFWVMFGAGVYAFDVANNVVSQNEISPSAIATVGWRGKFSIFTVGLGVGGQYVSDKITIAPLGLRSFELVGLADFGIRF